MNNLKIKNFKCFRNIEIELNKLTVLAGANGNGKSSVIQAILFLRQTIEQMRIIKNDFYTIQSNDINNNIPLNGNFCLSLGNSASVLNRFSSENEVNLIYNENNNNFIFKYVVDSKESKLYLNLKEFEIPKNSINFLLFKKEFYYLNAERIGPRIQHKLTHFEYPNAGWQGENNAQLINLENGYFKISDKRFFKDNNSPLIKDQLDSWLNYIVPGLKVKSNTNNFNLSGQILIENKYSENDPVLSTNMGFGISYVLPIITTGLIAEENSYLIIENPEAHLHPAAQSKIGRFLVMVANAGVNVIIETHSDHVISGIQIAVAEKLINSQDVTINFFNQDSENTQPEILPIKISSLGELSEWPKGFFDQNLIDYAHLFKLRSK